MWGEQPSEGQSRGGEPQGGVTARSRTETPKYKVEKSTADFEVRRYESRLVAEVRVSGDPRQASGNGFRVLAGYIFGNNVPAEEIAMTSPVERRPAGEGEEIAMTSPVEQRPAARGDGDPEADLATSKSWWVTFTMPSKWDEKSLPKPKDDRIRIVRIPVQRVAVVTFSGNPSAPKVEQRKDALLAAVRKAGLEPDGVPTYARYDPPWTPAFMRRNEIMLRLK